VTDDAEGIAGVASDVVSSAPLRLPPYFRCEPLGCALSVTSCADRYRWAQNASAAPHRRDWQTYHKGPCIGCPVGAGHADQRAPREWTDGKAVLRADAVRGLGYSSHSGACTQRMHVSQVQMPRAQRGLVGR